VKILISSQPMSLATALKGYASTATVEAEYGDDVVVGSVLTLAHHGPRSAQPAPSLAPVLKRDVEAVGISHVDLDTLLGIARAIMGVEVRESFAQLSAFVDVRGPHKLGQAGASAEDTRALAAFHAYSEANRVYPPRDGSVLDVTAPVLAALHALALILAGDETLLAAGDVFAAREATLNTESFKSLTGGVILRAAEAFTNHLYVAPDGTVARAVVAHNPKLGSVTVSLADATPGVSCRALVQSLWGPLAGGHDGIAGSPRGTALPFAEAERAAAALAALL
jgi:hypothetical protein